MIHCIHCWISRSVACQLGDLFISFIKRKSLQRCRNFKQGHGGVLIELMEFYLEFQLFSWFNLFY